MEMCPLCRTHYQEGKTSWYLIYDSTQTNYSEDIYWCRDCVKGNLFHNVNTHSDGYKVRKKFVDKLGIVVRMRNGEVMLWYPCKETFK